MSHTNHDLHDVTITYRNAYKAPAFAIESVDLHVDLKEEETIVTSELMIKRLHESKDLVLQGETLELLQIALNQQALSSDQFQVNDKTLTIFSVPDTFVLKTVVRIDPATNTALSGLYRSRTHFCTQCEAEGFRRITYYLDRPDVLSIFTTTIEADAILYPHLLSNGHLISRAVLENGRHRVTWHDPYKKPCYLFALVAGDFDLAIDSYVTMSKKTVELHVYVERGFLDSTAHAIDSLKAAMQFDEIAYGREYDLSCYMIVATPDFNMGAMENKGLNVFNTKYVLAKPETATDSDYLHVASVIAHEYLHNWTGNRVTCRDWFQLSLKEGLTIFRDQSFSEWAYSKPVMRIQDVEALRESQFPEDAGPLAHSVRPESYIEINNFYTATIYNKGAELARMLKTLLGDAAFRKGMDRYFERFDGQAVTIDDFVDTMQEVSGKDLTQFKRWYSQVGTPTIQLRETYDKAQHRYHLHCVQQNTNVSDKAAALPLHVPLEMGLLYTENGRIFERKELLELTEFNQTFTFQSIKSKPVPSLFRHFSAPVRVDFPYDTEALQFLALHDTDAFNRYEAIQQLLLRELLQLVQLIEQGKRLQMSHVLPTLFQKILAEQQEDLLFKSALLTIPSERYIGLQMNVVDVSAIHEARQHLQNVLSQHLETVWLELYKQYQEKCGNQAFSKLILGMRQLKNTALMFLLQQEKYRSLAIEQFQNSFKKNMTDQLSSLGLLVDLDIPERDELLLQFYDAWKEDALVMDKWLSLQAISKRQDTLQDVKTLMHHPIFDIKNPNKVYALIGAFSQRNPMRFHDESGAGYVWLREVVETLDRLNPQIAARMIKPLSDWRRYDNKRQELMQEQLQLILAKRPSADVYELVSKSLE